MVVAGVLQCVKGEIHNVLSVMWLNFRASGLALRCLVIVVFILFQKCRPFRLAYSLYYVVHDVGVSVHHEVFAVALAGRSITPR